MFKVLLVIPPDYEYTFPPLGTPALSAFLRQKGIDAEQIDLNLRYRDFLARHIRGPSIAEEDKKTFLEKIKKRFFAQNLKGRYYSRFLARGDDGIFPYLPYENNTNSSFYFTERLLSSDYLWRYLEDRAENTFYQFYEAGDFTGRLDKEKVDLLGISVISPSQVIPALTLGGMVKKRLPHIHVSIGGQWPTLYRFELLKRKDLFGCFDSVIIFEGESPLYELAMAIKNKRDISHIGGIILKEKGSIALRQRTGEDLNRLPCPDFDGLPLNDYDGVQYGRANLTYETSRGCYWSRCAYCVDVPLPRPSYRRKDPGLVAGDIKRLKNRYDAASLTVSDPGLSPRQMLEISKAILKESVEINWWCFARLDPGFNYKLFKEAGRAGLRKINFGFESASDRVCELLRKGNKKEHSLRIIKDCCNAGIMVSLQTMMGLPAETFSDGLDTVDFLIANRKFISEVVFNTYYLTPSNAVYENPKRYGIEYEDDPELPFRFFTPFDNPRGMTRKEAGLLQELYASLINEDSGNIDDNDKTGEDVSPEEVLAFPEDVSENWVEFFLNGESSRMRYLRNNETGKRFFFNESGGLIVDCIRKGYAVKDIHSSLAGRYPEDDADSIFRDFVKHSTARGFLLR